MLIIYYILFCRQVLCGSDIRDIIPQRSSSYASVINVRLTFSWVTVKPFVSLVSDGRRLCCLTLKQSFQLGDNNTLVFNMGPTWDACDWYLIRSRFTRHLIRTPLSHSTVKSAKQSVLKLWKTG